MVFIHGGAFFVGSNHDGPLDGDPDSNEDDPSYFVRSQNIIVVKINYRVGPLGFWYFEDNATKNNGNWALQDQELALKWIDEHIEAFGGDRTKRTLSGCSAGAQSAMVHLTENKIGSLFEQTIICAAPIGIPYFNIDQAINFGENLMVSVGCETVECLQEMDLRELIDSTWKHIIGGIDNKKFLAGPWGESLRYRKVTQFGILDIHESY